MSSLSYQSINSNTIITFPQNNKLQLDDIDYKQLTNINFFNNNGRLKEGVPAYDDASLDENSSKNNLSTIEIIEITVAILGVIIGIPSCIAVVKSLKRNEDNIDSIPAAHVRQFNSL